MLHLNRPGELSEREQKRLARHLASCGPCRELQKELQASRNTLTTLKNIEPPVPGTLNAEILAAVRRADSRRESFPAPRFRTALAGITLLLIGLFLVQQIVILQKVALLEESMARRPGPLTTKNPILPMALANMTQKMKEEPITISRDRLKALIKAYKKTQKENKMLIRLLRKTYPGFQNLDFQDGLDSGEIEYLLKNRERVLDFIKKI